MGARLVEERERACDETVVQVTSEPEAYAEGVLKVCEFYVASPVECAAGVTGADLKKRIAGIMRNPNIPNLSLGKRIFLATAGLAAVTAPVALGVISSQSSHATALIQTAGAPPEVPEPRLAVVNDQEAPKAAQQPAVRIAHGQAQRAGEQPVAEVEFDAASVKVVSPSDRSVLLGRTSYPGRFHYGSASMKSLLMEAYGVQLDEVIGPGWIDAFSGGNRYVVVATMPPNTTKERFQLMMQNLLKERFHLAVHHETRNFPGYDLVVSKGGTKLKTAGTLPRDPITGFSRESARYEARGVSMAQLAQHLGSAIATSLGTGPDVRPRVRDKTGIAGAFAFTLEYSCRDSCLPPLPSAGLPRPGLGSQPADAASEPVGSRLPDVLVAVEEQLGLKLQKVNAIPVDVIVVDFVDRAPTEN